MRKNDWMYWMLVGVHSGLIIAMLVGLYLQRVHLLPALGVVITSVAVVIIVSKSRTIGGK